MVRFILTPVRRALTLVNARSTRVRLTFTVVKLSPTGVEWTWSRGKKVGRQEKGAWPVAMPLWTAERVTDYSFADGSVGTEPRFTGLPSGPTTRMRGWLRKGRRPNSTSFSDRFP